MAAFYLLSTILVAMFGGKFLENPNILMANPTFTVAMAGSAFLILYIFWKSLNSSTHIRSVKRKRSLEHLSWQDYEQLCMVYLRKMGVQANLSKSGADGGIDIHARLKSKKIIVQCKHWKKPVGVATVRELYGLLHEQSAHSAIVFSSSRFSKPAWQFAKGKPIYLITGEKLLADIDRF